MRRNIRAIWTNPATVVLMAVLCTLLWGSAYPAIKTGYEIFGLATNDISGKLVFAGVRFLLAGIITLFFLCIQSRKIPFPTPGQWKGVLSVGLIQTALQYTFFYIGLSYTSGVNGSILNGSTAFFAVLCAHFGFKNDKLTLRKGIGCLIGFLGILLINVSGICGSSPAVHLLGDGMVILAAAAFAAGTMLGKRISSNINPLLLSGYQLGVGGAVLLAAGILSGGTLPVVTLGGLLLLFYMALLSAAAFTIWTFLLKYNAMSRITVYNFLTPVFGVLLSGLFLGEAFLSAANLAALLLVCAGIYVVNMHKSSNPA